MEDMMADLVVGPPKEQWKLFSCETIKVPRVPLQGIKQLYCDLWLCQNKVCQLFLSPRS